MMYFTELEQTFQIYIQNDKRPRIARVILRKKNKVGGIMLPNIKLYCKAIVIKTAWYQHKNRYIEQLDRIKNIKIKQLLYSQLIFCRGSKHMQWAEDSLFNKWCWKNWTDRCRKMKLDHLLTPHKIVNSKQIKDLNIRPKTTKLLGEIIGNKISDIAHSNIFSDISHQARETKEKLNKWDHIN